MLTTLTLLPRFSLESLPIILLIILILVLFAVLLWYALSKVPEPIGSWARWIAIIIGGILLLWFLISLIPGAGASADVRTTVPTRQVSIQHNGKVVAVILAADVADRRNANASTEADKQAIADAVEIELGHVRPTVNPCDRPASRLINDGRPVANCSESQGVK